MNINNQKLNSFSKQNSENKMSLLFTDISVTFFFDEEGFCKYSQIISKNSVKTFYIAYFVFKKIYQASGYLHFL